MTPAPDPTLARAAMALPDPSSLTATQIRALRLARTYRMVMARGGWKANNRFVSFATTKSLEAQNLVRRVNEKGRYMLIATGAGVMLLGIIDQRKTSGKGAGA